eukprot:COSAG06_NODE_47495_length_338_cov_4.753138_1_plen_94_part_10
MAKLQKTKLQAMVPVREQELVWVLQMLLKVLQLRRLQLRRLQLRRLQQLAGDGPAAGAAPPEMWSVASEVARRWIAARSAQHRGWVPRRPQDCW